MHQITGVPFYNISKLTFSKLLDDANQIAPNLNGYINGFSANIREIFEKFEFADEIRKMDDKNLLYEVIKKFSIINLSMDKIDNLQMGYIFEELIRIGAEQSNEEAGHHFTPREVIQLMVSLLLTPEDDLGADYKVKTVYDPACGTGGMLSEAEKYIKGLNGNTQVHLFGQDYNDEAWATCKADMLIKGEEADNVRRDNTFTKDRFENDTFDYMLANPPFGVSWKQEHRFIKDEADSMGYSGRFGAGLPRVNDGALLFLQHMISKMRTPKKEGSRIGIVFNGSPLFTGDAGSGESNIRQWIIENDWLEAIVALPDQLFYNTGISTYVWIVTNRKEKRRKKRIQLIDARHYYISMRKSLGQKRHQIGDGKENNPDQIGEITRIYDNFTDNETRRFTIDGKEKELAVSKIFDNEDFGYHKITVERSLRLNFSANKDRIALLEEKRTALITRAVTKGLNPDAKMKDSGIEWLGEVPEHWNVKKIKYICNINPQKTMAKVNPFSESLVCFLPMEKVGEDGNIDGSILKPINELYPGFTYFEKGDVIIAKITPCFENGKGAFLDDLPTQVAFGSTEFHVLRANQLSFNQFMFYISKSSVFRNTGESFMIGAAGQKRISVNFLKNFIVGLPPKNEQTAIANYLDRETKKIDTLISKIEQAITKHQEYKTALISAAVTGKIKVTQS